MLLYKDRGRTVHIFKIMNFLVQQLKNHVPIRQLRNQGHEEANMYVEHNTHPGSQIAPNKKFLTLEARGQTPKNWFFSGLLHKNQITLEWPQVTSEQFLRL